MGCGRSFFYLANGSELYISEGDYDMPCVCTFNPSDPLGPEDVLAFALLGIALRMTKDGAGGSVTRIVPQRLQRQVRALLGLGDAAPHAP